MKNKIILGTALTLTILAFLSSCSNIPKMLSLLKVLMQIGISVPGMRLPDSTISLKRI